MICIFSILRVQYLPREDWGREGGRGLGEGGAWGVFDLSLGRGCHLDLETLTLFMVKSLRKS